MSGPRSGAAPGQAERSPEPEQEGPGCGQLAQAALQQELAQAVGIGQGQPLVAAGLLHLDLLQPRLQERLTQTQGRDIPGRARFGLPIDHPTACQQGGHGLAHGVGVGLLQQAGGGQAQQKISAVGSLGAQ